MTTTTQHVKDAQLTYCAARAAYETICAECRRRVDAKFGAQYLPKTDAEMETYCALEVDAEMELGRTSAFDLRIAAEDVLIGACKDWALTNGLADASMFDSGRASIRFRQKLIDICMSVRA